MTSTLKPFVPAPEGRLAEIVEIAGQLLDDYGWEHVSTRLIAEEMGIKAPSLYKHIHSREAIAAHLATDALSAFGDELYAALDAGDGSVVLLARYRELALARPHLYRLMTGQDFPREDLPTGLEEWAGTPFYLAAGDDPVRAQALWAFAHGMAALEINERFAGDGLPAAGVWEAGSRALGNN